MNEAEINLPPNGTPNVCTVEGCDRFARAKGLCTAHHKRVQKYGDVRANVPVQEGKRKSNSRALCNVEGCDRPYYGKGLCAPHSWRLKTHGSVRSDLPLKTKGTGHDRKSPAYTYWWTLRMSCSNPKSVGFAKYGARGVRFCEEWGTYDQFLKDLGERPSRHHVLVLHPEALLFAPGTCHWELKSSSTTPSKYKITFEIAEEIRRRYVEGGEDNLPKNLATEFNIGVNNIYMIIKRQIWK